MMVRSAQSTRAFAAFCCVDAAAQISSASWADSEGPSRNAFARLLGGFRSGATAESRLVRFRCMHADLRSRDGGQFMSLFQIKQDDSCYQWFPPMQRHRNDTINARDCCSKSHRPLPWRPVVRVQLPRNRYGVRQDEPTLDGQSKQTCECVTVLLH